jgi:UDP-glucose 4-epimerase
LNILVTGGAGFVGSACLRWMLSKGHNAIAVDNLAQGHKGSVAPERLILADIADEGAMVAAMQRIKADAVMHFAAATYVGESVSNPEYHYRNNIAGTLSLLNAMRKAGVQRMLFSSTCATYGMNPKVPMNEESEQKPFSPYARTKLAVEWMIRDFAHAYGLGFTLLRYFNAAGASPDGKFGEDHRPENHLIPLVLEVPLGKRKAITVFGNDYPTPDGTCLRDYVHVDDLAQAHQLAIEATQAPAGDKPGTAEVFNIGTGQGQSVFEIIHACERVTGTKIPFEVAARRPGDPPALVADPTKLKSRLGWKPQYSIDQTVASAWKWHQSHPNGYPD